MKGEHSTLENYQLLRHSRKQGLGNPQFSLSSHYWKLYLSETVKFRADFILVGCGKKRKIKKEKRSLQPMTQKDELITTKTVY